MGKPTAVPSWPLRQNVVGPTWAPQVGPMWHSCWGYAKERGLLNQREESSTRCLPSGQPHAVSVHVYLYIIVVGGMFVVEFCHTLYLAALLQIQVLKTGRKQRL